MNTTNPVTAIHYYQDKTVSGSLVTFVRLNRTSRNYTPTLNSRSRLWKTTYNTSGITVPSGGYWFTHYPAI